MGVPDTMRLRELETENNKLKNLLAETMLEKLALRIHSINSCKPAARRQVDRF